MEKTIGNRVLFEDYVYEKRNDSFGTEHMGKSIWIEFGGGFFFYDCEEVDRDMSGFETSRISIRKMCTIEHLRRSLLEKKQQGMDLSDLDKWEQNKLIAKVVYENAV